MTPLLLATDADALQACRRELAEAIEQQAATREILSVISRLPADPQPVFEAIVAAGVRLFGDAAVAISRPEGGMVHALAIAESDSERAQRWARVFPFPLTRQYIHGAAMLDCRVIDVPDLLEPGGPFDVGKRNVAPSGYRAMAVVPLVREGRALGAIAVVRVRPGPLTEHQRALMQTFADQALIAIENARLFNESQQALERQTATGEILASMSGSIMDTQPVFDTIARNLLRLFGTRFAIVALAVDGRIEIAAIQGEPGFAKLAESYPIVLDDKTHLGRTILSGRTSQLAPIIGNPASPPLTEQNARRHGYDAQIAAPMLREGKVFGALVTARREATPFDDRQAALMMSFADQAVIAIENTRLSNEREARNRELAEALEQQTATSEILRVISSSPTDVQPVFESIARASLALCGAHSVNLLMLEGDLLHAAALTGTDAASLEAIRRAYPRAPDPHFASGRAVLTRRTVAIVDVLAEPDYPMREAAVSGGFRSVLGVPLMRDGRAIGAITVGRPEPGRFPDRQIALLQTFADQAVIAIENTRLFTELQDKTRELEVANRHKTAFLANMSHELRTPLNAILGFTRIVLRETRAQIAQKQAENLEKILASARHLVSLINATLDLTRIEAGRIEITPSQVLPAPLLDECLRSVEPLAADGVRLDARLEADLPPLWVDAEKLHQVLLNLLGNAVKFTERGRIELRAATRGDRIEIEVEDSGIGIPPEKLEAVFEEFEQVDASHTRTHGGTGLGLAIARRLARAMGGDLVAVSALGRGSTFTLTLPLRWSDARDA
jgi:signal transduction histidine kinase